MKTSRKIFSLLLLILCIVVHNLIIINISNGNDVQREALSDESSYKIRLKQVYKSMNVNIDYDQNRPTSLWYKLTDDKNYHYEFRYELNTNTNDNIHRLMVIFYGANHACQDMWDFSVGVRILSALRQSGYSILAICSKRRTYDVDLPINNNFDAKYIYLSLQMWMNTIYYAKFKRYPLLYVHGTSRGSKFASLISRILPVQSQLLNIYPGHRQAMTTASSFDTEIQTRFISDSAFANWFFFHFCYNITSENKEERRMCPFESDSHYFYPLSPIYFTFLKNDQYQSLHSYEDIIEKIRKNSLKLGGELINDLNAIKLHILSPVLHNITYIKEKFPPWSKKLYSIKLFYDHFTNSDKYQTLDPNEQTCGCLDINFKYYENKPNLTEKWSKRKQDEYSDYVRDIRTHQQAFCEEVCGDLMATHSMTSRSINESLNWIKHIEQRRRQLFINDYTRRPLRIWMYDKKVLLQNVSEPFCQEVNWLSLNTEYQMYASESLIQDYFRNLNRKEYKNRRHLQWTENPFLADYFVIPSDIIYFYFHSKPSFLTDKEFRVMHQQLNKNYYEILFKNIQRLFPYWSMASEEDLQGNNHIVLMPGGRNMGILVEEMQNKLKNTIQLAFTGIRQDLLPPNTPIAYQYRGLTVTYRHNYDIIIPQFVSSKCNQSSLDDVHKLVENKMRLVFFAGLLFHKMTSYSARSLLRTLMNNLTDTTYSFNMSMKIGNKRYDKIKIIDGHMNISDYIESIQTSVFLLCPEGYLPWSPRLYESVMFGSIPLILADNIVLPFERFINWRSFSAKLNVSNILTMFDFIEKIVHFDQYIHKKVRAALHYLHAFQYPYRIVNENLTRKIVFVPTDDLYGMRKNPFYYISLELRCRRLEQFYGLTANSWSKESKQAQDLACQSYPMICPCHQEYHAVAFQEFF